MKLKKFSTQIFAGLTDTEVPFTEGLNVILGPNEAGKSTIINAIFATLFKEPKIKSRSNEDKKFNERFLPYPEGNYIHGKVTLENSGEEIAIEKKWSRNNPSVLLKLPNGNIIDNASQIKKQLNEVLIYGSSTYDNIVFAKQREIKRTVKNIAEDSNVKNTVNDFLRKAVMEMDGVVSDELKEKIEAEKEKLISRWNLEKGEPENPDRDFNNPYKTNLGKIYEAYVARGRLKNKIRIAEEAEKEYQEANHNLNSLQNKLQQLKKELAELSALEEDIYRRGTLQPKLEAKNEKLNELEKIKKRWPDVKSEIKDQQDKLATLRKKIGQLENEREEFKKKQVKQELAAKINKVEDYQEKIKKLEQQKEKLAVISSEKVKKLAALEKTISNTEAQLEAAKLQAKVLRSTSDNLSVIKGVEEEEKISVNSEFVANGYLRVFNDDIDIEVRSAEINFTELKNDFKEARQEKLVLLEEFKDLNINNSEEAREKLNHKKVLSREISRIKEDINDLLKEKALEELKNQHNKIEIKEDIREIEIIEAEMEQLKDREINSIKVSLETNKNIVSDWKDDHESIEKLETKIRSLKEEISNIRRELAGLADLPAKFESVAEFREYLKNIRVQREQKKEKKHELKEKLLDIQSNMPAESVEELKDDYKRKDKRFKSLIARAKRILQIERAFQETLEMMDEKSFQPLIESFNDYLNKLTAGDYLANNINDDFAIEIIKQEDKTTLPVNINLLSYGTYDSVAMALRFALYDNLFQENPGFIILDDCLVNLDPERTDKALELINSFKDKYQVIFSTCDPETADRLGGNRIELV